MIRPLLFLFTITSSSEYEILIDGLHDTIIAEKHRESACIPRKPYLSPGSIMYMY